MKTIRHLMIFLAAIFSLAPSCRAAAEQDWLTPLTVESELPQTSSGIRQVVYGGLADDLPEPMPGRTTATDLPDFDCESLCEAVHRRQR